MSTFPPKVLLVLFAMVGVAHAQAPTGTIDGIVTDSSGALLPGAHVSIVNQETGQARAITTSTDGTYSAAALPSGPYRVFGEAADFKRLERAAAVEAGTTTTVNLALELGDVSETVTVSGVLPLIRHDHHQVAGVVTREQIENLPLNGRNFLELAKLEPGVTNPVRGTNNRTFVAALGSGLQTIPRIGYTQVTVDGANINAIGTIGAILQVSQDVVQEFQIATVNFDQATGLTTNGAVNIVTRSGGNEYHGSGFFFYRDHNLAAYPGLSRDPLNPDPFFERRQFGLVVGGPIRRDRAFFLGSYERNDQRGVVSVQPRSEFAGLGGISPSPYLGDMVSGRVDVRLGGNDNGFVRYTHDGNQAFAPLNDRTDVLPSGWSRLVNRANQVIGGLTSVISPVVVNDARVSYFRVDTPERPASREDCPAPCFGLGAPRISIADAGVAFGDARALSVVGRRVQATDSLAVERGRHGLRFGFDWEHSTARGAQEPAVTITLWSPAAVRQQNPSIRLPASFTTLDDILQLPLQNVTIAVGAVPERDFRPERVVDLYRVSASDTWRVGSRLTVNAGLAWSYEPNALNHDLTKPALLISLLGVQGLNAPRVQRLNFSPTLGFAWTATRDGKTVVRGGAGRYFDPAGSANSANLNTERAELSPLGTGRVMFAGENIVHDGGTLRFLRPTAFTGADLRAILDKTQTNLAASLNPDNRDFSVRNIDRTKLGTNLSDPSYVTPSALHVSAGMQRELAGGVVVSADAVWKRFLHTYINGIDYNRFNSTGGTVIPLCTAQQRSDVRAICSNGAIMFDTTTGRARYMGLLARVEKRLSHGVQFLASYALGSYVGTNGTGTGTAESSGGRVFGFNNDNWFENYGPLPTDRRHELNVSSFVELPSRVQLALTLVAYSRPPFTPYVSGIDFNGDGTSNDLLPGTKVNQFGRGLDRADLAALVVAYNAQYASRQFGARIAPPLTLPASYSFDDSFFAADLRLGRSFRLGVGAARLSLFGEVFNVLNTPNLVGYNGNLANADAFGQPSSRFSQVFGSGGPRAFQLGARVNF